jgi:hypothetical protein
MTTQTETAHAGERVWRRWRWWMAVGIGLAWSPIAAIMASAIWSGCRGLIAAEMPLFIIVPCGGLITWLQLRHEEANERRLQDIIAWSSGIRRRRRADDGP